MSVYKNDNALHLKEALFSIYNQTYQSDQIVLVCDGPVTLEIERILKYFQKFSSFEVYHLEINVGLGPALNYGLTKVRNQFVFRMDSDDFSHPQRFEKHLQFFLENNLDVSSTYVFEFEEDICKNRIKKIVLDNTSIISILPQGCPFNHPATLFKKSSVVEFGGYENIYLKEDMGLWVKLSSCNNLRMTNFPQPLLYMRINPNTYKRRRGLKIVLSEIKLFLLHFKYHRNPFKFLYLLIIIPIRLMPTSILNIIYKLHRKIVFK